MKAKTAPAKAGYVLVVDDEEQNRTLLRDTLEARNYEVAEAENGGEALARAAQRVPDVVLLDLMMPGMDGFVVCRELKRRSGTAAVPVLMITALSERAERLMGIEAGANDFLNKPVDLQDLLLRVANAVYTKRLYDRLQIEQEKSERLLLNILPKPIADRIKEGQTNVVDTWLDVTVLFSDLVGFTRLAAHIPVEELLAILNEVFTTFDSLTEKHGLEKIKTIGDAYMAAGGLSLGEHDSPSAAVRLAIEMHDAITEINHNYGTSLRLRVGINHGPVIAGVIGRSKFSYDLWGDTVNIASRLESLAEPGAIHISESVYSRLNDQSGFTPAHLTEPKSGAVISSYLLVPSAGAVGDDRVRSAA